MNSLIVFSGGMDSTTALYKYRNQGDNVEALIFDYGSKHNEREIRHAVETCSKLGVNHTVFFLDLSKHFNSALLQTGGDIPDGHYEDSSMKKTVVPFRNGIMLSIAAGIAESKDFDNIVIGNHAGDHAIYPDCRNDFVESMRESIRLGTYKNVKLLSPFCHLSKREIALIGRDLQVDWCDTWSCYKGREIHCGVCGTCVERKEALKNFDPTSYEE